MSKIDKSDRINIAASPWSVFRWNPTDGCKVIAITHPLSVIYEAARHRPVSDAICFPKAVMLELLPLDDASNPFHLHHMGQAIDEALVADAEDEVPVGCVIVSLARGEVIAKAHNQKERLQDPTAHAEIVAITQAAASLGSWRLEQCILYVTLEPCAMCAGAIVQARMPLVVFGCTDPKAGACVTLFRLADDPRLNHRARVVGGVMADRCAHLLSQFFARKRALGKK